MRRTRTWLGAGAAAAVAICGLPAHAYPPPGTNTLVTVSHLTGKAPLTGGNSWSRISADGRFVAYGSTSSDIVPGDTNGFSDVFEWNRLTGQTQRISVSTEGLEGVPAKDDTKHPIPMGALMGAISADGRYVAFYSDYVNLVLGDTNLASDVFVHDRVAGWTKRVSVSSTGVEGNDASGPGVAMSANGRYVAFSSFASNLVPGDTNGTVDVFVHDMTTGRTIRVSDNTDGADSSVAISPDGRYVGYDAYPSGSSSTTDSAGLPQVWVRDLKTGQHRRADVFTGGAAPTQTPVVGGASIMQDGLSRGGRYVLFGSNDAYVPTRTTQSPSVAGFPAYEFYRHDFRTGRTERVGVTSAGEERDGGLITTAAMTPDGRFVVWDSVGDYNSPTRPPPCNAFTLNCPNRHVYRRDMLLGSTEIETWTYDGKVADSKVSEGADFASVDASGRYVVFISHSEGMYAGEPTDTEPGSSWWTYVRDRGPARGVGGLAAAGKLSVAGAPAFATTGTAAAGDPAGDVSTALTSIGADLTAASVAYRPQSADLYLRLQLARMPSYAAANPALVYACAFTVHGARYEMRAAKTPLGASFGLYRNGVNGWQRVADLHGGYGTTGAEVVAAVPLQLLGAQRGARLTDVVATTGFGTLHTGVPTVADRLRI